MSRPRLIALLLALVTLLAYLPAARDGFVDYDDQDYVTENSMVQKGLTWTGVKWAFTTVHASNWHPVTWLSLMTDSTLSQNIINYWHLLIFGYGISEPNPGVYHSVNALFHAANAVLLFVLLLRLTGELWPAAFIAALFAWHPLHVESVAWISERKDVLSTFFALLTLLAYTRYVEKSKVESPRSKVCYGLALGSFALGLMSKPMLVTLPFVMLLLDYWPLGRISDFGFRISDSKNAPVQAIRRSALNQLVFEKWPFFLLTAVSCAVTFLVQRSGEAVMTLQQFPLRLRVANALIAGERYLGKTFWPSDLAVLYPLPDHLSWMRAMAATAAGLLLVVSWLVWRTRRRFPYLLAGWLWFLGTLVPVIGLVQVGSAAMADRYTYFPLIGVFIAVAFGVRELANRFRIPKTTVVAAAALALAGCLAVTENQLRYWCDSETLFTHALAVTEDNHVAHVNLGVAYEQEGRLNEALAEYRAAEQLAPELYHIHNNLGNILDNLGHPNEALVEYRKAAQLNPRLPALHDGAGIVLAELGRFNEAMQEFTNAARLDPANPWPHFALGKVLLQQGRDPGAIDQFREALRLEPDNFKILAYTAHVLAAAENTQIRDGKTALMLAAKANALTGGAQPFVLDALGMACAETGDFTNALEVTRRAFDLASAAKMKKLAPLRQRLQLYQNHQPWRESFLATNAPVKH